MAAKHSWEGAKLFAGVALLVVMGFWLAYKFISPAPPRTIRLAAGEKGGAYARFAERYRAELARNEIDLEIRYSGGTVGNLALLRDGEVDVGLVQAGVADPETAEGLESLGSLFYEPLWIFLRRGVEVEFLSGLRGLRLEVGPADSGTRALTAALLAANDVTPQNSEWVSLDDKVGAWSRVDVMFSVGSADSPLVRSIIAEEDVTLLDVDRAEAYTRLDRTLTRLVLPEGVMDLSRNIPPRDTVLVSSVGELVAGPDFHPALVDVLLQAAAAVHSRGDVFSPPGHFPSPHNVDLPLHPDAARYFKYGPPFLQRYLPFWAASQIDRLKVMLIPLIALLIPLLRVFPPTYRWRVRSRIYRWYKELRAVDPGPNSDLDAEDLAARLAEVERIEREVARVPTPTSYAHDLYALLLHVDFVHARLVEAKARAEGDVAGRTTAE